MENRVNDHIAGVNKMVISHLTYKPFEKLKHISDKNHVSDKVQKCPITETTINIQNTVPHTVNSVKKVDK